jgi:hypothetical protein
MRDIKTQQIVYETSAQRQDVWTDDPAIFGILFDAALTGFPKPPQGQRNVRTVIQPPGAQPSPAARRQHLHSPPHRYASSTGRRGAGQRGTGTLICNLQQLPGPGAC